MTEAQARAAIEEAVSTPMLRPVTVTGDNKTWTLDPRGIVVVDVDSMLARRTRRDAPPRIVQRLNNQLAGAPLPADIKPAYSVDASAIATWVSQTATR